VIDGAQADFGNCFSAIGIGICSLALVCITVASLRKTDTGLPSLSVLAMIVCKEVWERS